MTHEALRLAREERGWSPEELARRSGLRPRTIELIDRGQFEELPAGLYGRSSIRSYASAVGLKAEDVLEALGPLLPGVEDPLDGLARRHGHARKAEPRPHEPMASAAPVQPAVVPEAAEDLSFVQAPEDASGMVGAAPAHDGGRPWGRALAASAIDVALLATMGAVLVWLTAMACATPVAVALRIGGPAMALVFALIVTLYFVLFGGVGNATPGVLAMRLEVRPAGRTVLNARDVFGRARRSILHDSSLVAD